MLLRKDRHTVHFTIQIKDSNLKFFIDLVLYQRWEKSFPSQVYVYFLGIDSMWFTINCKRVRFRNWFANSRSEILNELF